jgi:hypothetical protein
MRKVSGVAFVLGVACSCSGAPSAVDFGRVPAGTWGGEHLELVVTDGGGTSEFDCAHGSLDSPLDVDTDGRFDVPGTLVREAGPVREDVPEPRQSVRYAGSTDGRAMAIDVVSASGERIGSFRLELGRPALLRKCLSRG